MIPTLLAAFAVAAFVSGVPASDSAAPSPRDSQ